MDILYSLYYYKDKNPIKQKNVVIIRKNRNLRKYIKQTSVFCVLTLKYIIGIILPLVITNGNIKEMLK